MNCISSSIPATAGIFFWVGAIRLVLLVLLVSMTGCGERDKETAALLQSGNTVSGKLTLYLNEVDVSEVFVRFELREQDGSESTLAQTDFMQPGENPVRFSLGYPAERVNPQNRYLLVTTVSIDAEGKEVIATMSSPVLTQGMPSILNMAIQPPLEPIE